MNWTEAVEAMKRGAWVQRRSQQATRLIAAGDDGSPQVYEGGEEATRLVTAYSEDGQFVRVFQGAWSKVLFEPEDRHTSAVDWVVVDAGGPNAA